jgi:hypothetical protein
MPVEVAAWRRLGLGVLLRAVPGVLIDEAVAATQEARAVARAQALGRPERPLVGRVRVLPARVVVVFVLACAVFSGEGYQAVWRRLVSGWAGLARLATPTTTAFSRARQRIGTEPLAWLFAQVRGARGVPGVPGAAAGESGPATPATPGVFAFGLRVVSWDGTWLSVPDSAANAARFPVGTGGGGVRAGFPRVRLMALIECGTRAVLDAAFGAASEQVLAQRLLPALGPGMLLLADRNFSAYQLWAQIRRTGAHALWRVQSSRKLPVLKALPDGSWLSQILAPQPLRKTCPPITVRVVKYTVAVHVVDPRTGTAHTRTETVRLITSLLDPDQAPAAELAACYHQRWQSETSYQELKTYLRGPDVVLRSRDPDGVEQELYAYLIIYQALRHLIVQAADEVHLDPDRFSLLSCLRTARDTIINLAIETGESLTTALTHLMDILLEDQITPRDRASPRHVKRSRKPYRGKQPGTPSTPATYTLTIQPT